MVSKLNNMTQEEILEGNKLISKFDWSTGQHVGMPPKPEELEYSWSFNAILPVVIKIRYKYKATMVTEISDAENNILDHLNAAVCRLDIMEIRMWVLEFIKWFNQQKK